MDEIATLYKNPCFASKVSLTGTAKKHHKLCPDVVLQNLSRNPGHSDNNHAVPEQECCDGLDANIFERHPRYFSEECKTSMLPITNSDYMSMPVDEKYTNEKNPRRTNKPVRPLHKRDRYKTATAAAASVTITQNEQQRQCTVHQSNYNTDVTATAAAASDEVMGTKLNCTLLKIRCLLEEISVRIRNGIQPVDSDEDSVRRHKRVAEFFSRFTRNYLYQLARQSTEARKQGIRAGGTVQDALTSVGHTVLQALQAYQQHVPLTVPTAAHSKCLTLLTHIGDMCALLQGAPATRDIEQQCAALASTVTTCLLPDGEQASTSKGTTRVSLLSHTSSTTVPFHRRQSLDKRLSMYNTVATGGWPRPRSSVPSRYKLAPYKPPVHSEARTCLTDGCTAELPAVQPSASNEPVAERRARRAVLPEDQIQTMVGLELHKERLSTCDRVDAGGGGESVREDNFRTMLQFLLLQLDNKQHRHREDVSSSSSSSSSSSGSGRSVSKANSNGTVLDKLRGLVNQVQEIKESQRPAALHAVQDASKTRELSRQQGPANAKLVCVKHWSCYQDAGNTPTPSPPPAPASSLQNTSAPPQPPRTNDHKDAAMHEEIIDELLMCVYADMQLDGMFQSEFTGPL